MKTADGRRNPRRTRHDEALKNFRRAAQRYMKAQKRRNPQLAQYAQELSKAKHAYCAIINEVGD